MTYAKLIEALKQLKPEQLRNDCTVMIDGEYRPIRSMGIAGKNNDVLNEGHPYLLG